MARFVAFAATAAVSLSMLGSSCGGPSKPPDGLPPGANPGLSTDVISTYAEPLIVDWNSGHRTDLEVLTRDRIAVVRYQKNAITMLKDCALEGEYGYVGVNKKEDVIRMDSLDEVAANLPGIFSAAGAKLGAEMQRGTTLDLGLVTVGKRTAARTSAQRSELKGDCAGATHFVRGATIGAFAVQTGKKSKLATVAGLFGGGVEAKSESSSVVSNKDGSLPKCESATTDAKQAPEGCGSLLRLELRPFDAPAKAAQKDEKGNVNKADEIPACSTGLVWDGAKCAKEGSAKAFACTGKDESTCRSQCDKSNAKSCTQLARIYRSAGKDPIQAVEFFKKACGLGDESACAEHGWHLLNGIDVNPDRFKAFEAFEKACKAGDGLGCSHLAGMHRAGIAPEASLERSFALYKRACAGGFLDGCVELGTMHEKGIGTPRDPKQALAIYERACRAGTPDGCAHAGSMFTSARRGAGLDRQKAMSHFRSACEKNSALGCTELGNMFYGGQGMEREKQKENDQEAAKLYEKACKLWGGAEGCARLGGAMLYGHGLKRDVPAGVAKIEEGCSKGSGYACAALGKIHGSGLYDGARPIRSKDVVKAYEYYQKSCNLFDGEGCRLLGQVYRQGESSGVARDDKKSHEYFARACRTGHPSSCHQVGEDHLMGVGTKPDKAKALAHFAMACDSGYANACNKGGVLYDSGEGGVKQDKAKAAEWFEKACDWGDGWACNNLAIYIEKGIYKGSPSGRALDLYAKACESMTGDPTSCSRLGLRYFVGNGVEKDAMKGLEYFRKGCETKFDKPSCSQLGDIYRNGRYGVARNYAEALKYLTRACWGRVDSACETLAEMYSAGQGTSPNPTEAARIRRESCDRGNTMGCRNLAKMYREGVGVPKKDLATAAAFHDKACQLRSNADCYELALMHDKGDGVKADGKKVAELFQRACAYGNYEACSNMGYFIYTGTANQKKDPTLGLSKLRYGCSNYGWRFKDEKERVKNIWACSALKKLNQKLEAPAPKGTAPPTSPGYYGGGTQKM